MIVNLQHLPSLCLLLLSLSLQLQVPLKLFIALLYLLAQLRLFWLLRGGNSGEADAFLDFFVVDEGDKLEQVDLAENVLENEPQVGLGLDRTDQTVEHTRDKVVLHLVSRYYVIVFGSLMLGIVDKDVECSKCVKEHQIGILCFGSLNKGVVEEQLGHVLYNTKIKSEMVLVPNSFLIRRRWLLLHKEPEFRCQFRVLSYEEEQLIDFIVEMFSLENRMTIFKHHFINWLATVFRLI